MSLRLLLRDHPKRAFALVTDTHALIFRHSLSCAGDVSNNGPRLSSSKCMVEFTTLEDVDLTDYRVIKTSINGTLGLINVSADTFLCVISGAVRVASVRRNENVQRILSVDFC